MKDSTSRRAFLRSSLQSAAALAVMGAAGGSASRALEPFQRGGQARLLLSLAAYSFRDYMVDTNHKRDKPVEASKLITMFQFLDFCAEHGCAGAELTSYYFPAKLTNEYLLDLKRHAFMRGVAISGTAVGNTFTHGPGEKRDKEVALVKEWVDRAQVLGAPHIRVFAGTAQNGMPADEARRNCIAALEECAQYAGSKGVFLGIENHGGIVAEPAGLLEIVRAVKSPWVGINLDTGNFQTEDPYADVAKCAPYAVNVQYKVEIRRKGQQKETADMKRMFKVLRDANYQGYVALEYESSEDPNAAVPRILTAMRQDRERGMMDSGWTD